ncbi:uncharacterized protein PG986_007845 [Apiospora aurea]|uniref:Uncharacterized protein n=1 Tax=Apiospora aurea TaxID=335848 RepID=A0ABR1QDQ7_9PEZI
MSAGNKRWTNDIHRLVGKLKWGLYNGDDILYQQLLALNLYQHADGERVALLRQTVSVPLI